MNSERIEVRDEHDNLVAGIEVDTGEDDIFINITIRSGHSGSISLISNLCLYLDSAVKFHRQIGLAIENARKHLDRLCTGEGVFESEMSVEHF